MTMQRTTSRCGTGSRVGRPVSGWLALGWLALGSWSLPARAAAGEGGAGGGEPTITVALGERAAAARQAEDGVPLVERYREGGGDGWMSSWSHVVFFWIGAVAALLGAVVVVVSRRPMRSALGLLLTVLATAGLFLLLRAELLAALQVLIYAGAVVVLLVFVITFLDQGAISAPGGRRLPVRVLGAAAAVYVFYLVGRELFEVGLGTRLPVGEGFGTTAAVARELFGAFLIPFEAASMLLLAAIVGAVAVARGRTDPEAGAGVSPPAGDEGGGGGAGAGGGRGEGGA